MWKFALGGIIVGTTLAFIAMKINLLSIGKFGSGILTPLLKRAWRLMPSTSYGKNTPKMSERIFDEVNAVLQKYRPELRKEFGITPNEVKDVQDIYRMADLNKDDAFGVMLWRNDGKGIHFQNLITDSPENLLNLLMERVKKTMNMVMKNMPKEQALEVLKKGFGGNVDVVDLTNDCKDIPIV